MRKVEETITAIRGDFTDSQQMYIDEMIDKYGLGIAEEFMDELERLPRIEESWEDVNDAFTWSRTLRGADFWEEIHCGLSEWD